MTARLLPLLLVSSAVAAAAQSPRLTTEQGVYTPDQAALGRASYETSCRQCHGASLAGGVARQLTGEAFLSDWATLSLERLLDRVRTMPPGSAPRLPDDEYVAITAFILEANGFPPGDRPLTADGAMKIAIGGTAAPPDSGLVLVIGCLRRTADRGWTLTDASEPARTKNPDPSAADERVRLAALPTGTRTFELMNVFPSPDRFDGHRVEVKGLLIRRRAADRVNVTAVEMIAPACR